MELKDIFQYLSPEVQKAVQADYANANNIFQWGTPQQQTWNKGMIGETTYMDGSEMNPLIANALGKGPTTPELAYKTPLNQWLAQNEGDWAEGYKSVFKNAKYDPKYGLILDEGSGLSNYNKETGMTPEQMAILASIAVGGLIAAPASAGGAGGLSSIGTSTTLADMATSGAYGSAGAARVVGAGGLGGGAGGSFEKLVSDYVANPTSWEQSLEVIPEYSNYAGNLGDVGKLGFTGTAGQTIPGVSSGVLSGLGSAGQGGLAGLGGALSLGQIGTDLAPLVSNVGNIPTNSSSPEFGPYTSPGSTNMLDTVRKFLSSNTGGNIVDLLSGLYGLYQNSQNQGNMQDFINSLLDKSDPFASQRGMYQQKLADAYNNPMAIYNTPEYQGISNLYRNQLEAKDAAAGRRSQYASREQDMNDHFLSYLDKYRTGLQAPAGVQINPSGASAAASLYGQGVMGQQNQQLQTIGNLASIFKNMVRE